MFTRYRKRTIVGITVQMFAQINGINIISFYLPSTLAAAGYDNRKSLLFTAANALPYTAATIVTWWLADRWGRKPLLILGGQFLLSTSLGGDIVGLVVGQGLTNLNRFRHGRVTSHCLRLHRN